MIVAFFTSPDGHRERWLVYHVLNALNLKLRLPTRSFTPQKFHWNDDGKPILARPCDARCDCCSSLLVWDGPLETAVEGQQFQLVNVTTQVCLALRARGRVGINFNMYRQNDSDWVLETSPTGQRFIIRLSETAHKQFLEAADCS